MGVELRLVVVEADVPDQRQHLDLLVDGEVEVLLVVPIEVGEDGVLEAQIAVMAAPVVLGGE